MFVVVAKLLGTVNTVYFSFFEQIINEFLLLRNSTFKHLTSRMEMNVPI